MCPTKNWRRAAWKQPRPRFSRGLLAKYIHLVSTASVGAVTDLRLFDEKK
jgi:dihydroxy-acid dehydratase